MLRYPSYFFLSTLLVGLFTVNTGYAQFSEQPKFESMSLEDLLNVKISTVAKMSQKAGEAPATVIVVTADQIKTRGYRNLAQILNDLPDFKVNDKSDLQHYNHINIRGIDDNDHFVIMLDGIRISSPTNESLPLLENFPIYLAKQIEIVYGPGSALYGADAMGGVINIITTKGEEGNKLVASSVAGTQGYTGNSLYLHRNLKNGFRFTAAGQYVYDAQPDFSKIYPEAYDVSPYKTGSFNTIYGPVTSIQPLSTSYQAPIKNYNVYAALEKDNFYFKLLTYYSQTPSSTTLKPQNGIYNKDVFYGQGVTTASAGYSDSIGRMKSATTLTGSFFHVNPQSNFRNVYGSMNHGYKYSTGSMMKAEEQLSLTVSDQLNFVGGVTGELFQSTPKTPELQFPVSTGQAELGILLNSQAINNPRGLHTDFFHITYNNIGAYIQTQYKPVRELAIIAGVRYDRNSRFGATVNPRVGAVFMPTQNTTIKALYGTAYWAPSPMTSFQTYGSFYTLDSGRTYKSAFWSLPNPFLKPETSQNIELSIQQKLGKKFSATLTGYATTMNNLIKDVSDDGHTNLYNHEFLGWTVSYVQVPINLSKQEVTGGNLMINSMFNIGEINLNLYSSVSYVNGTIEEVFSGNKIRKVELPLIAPWQFRFGLDGKWNDIYLAAKLQIVGKQRLGGYVNDADPYERQTIAGYTLMNLSTGYTISDRVNIFVNVENALNKHYFNPLNGNLKNNNTPDFPASYQDPLRAMAGVRITL